MRDAMQCDCLKHPPPHIVLKRAAVQVLLLAVLCGTLSGCYELSTSNGGAETRFTPPRQVDPSDIALPDGYRIEVVATGLTFPTGIAFNEHGGIYVTEAGYSYGEYFGTPRLLRLEPGGGTTIVAEGSNPPWNGLDYHAGSFFVAGGTVYPGQILRIDPDGLITVLANGLPSLGDHHTNGPLVSKDGWVYFGQGTATNSGVVGLDNYDFGWLKRHPGFHDVPCEDVILTGLNYTTSNPFTSLDDRISTGAFVPFGTPTESGQIIPGGIPCSGAIMRVRAEGGPLEVVAWGLRNPFALAWSPDGNLYATDNQYDERGSRPVFGTGDLLWRIEPGAWYGWPDYYGSIPFTGGFGVPDGATPYEQFRDGPDESPLQLLRDHPSEPPHPAAHLGVHSSSNGFDFSRNPAFGHEGQAFIAQFGDQAPEVGKVLAPVGFKVVRVDVDTGVIEDFAVNKGKTNGPASWLKAGGLERPIAVRFDPSGTALYIVDFGVMTVNDGQTTPYPGTGVIWKITRTGGAR